MPPASAPCVLWNVLPQLLRLQGRLLRRTFPDRRPETPSHPRARVAGSHPALPVLRPCDPRGVGGVGIKTRPCPCLLPQSTLARGPVCLRALRIPDRRSPPSLASSEKEMILRIPVQVTKPRADFAGVHAGALSLAFPDLREGETRERSFLKTGSLTGKWGAFSRFRDLPSARLSDLHMENAP